MIIPAGLQHLCNTDPCPGALAAATATTSVQRWPWPPCRTFGVNSYFSLDIDRYLWPSRRGQREWIAKHVEWKLSEKHLVHHHTFAPDLWPSYEFFDPFFIPAVGVCLRGFRAQINIIVQIQWVQGPVTATITDPTYKKNLEVSKLRSPSPSVCVFIGALSCSHNRTGRACF